MKTEFPTELRKPVPRGTSSPRLPELDGLRALAILLVLIWHNYLGLVAFPVRPGSPLAWFHQLLSLTWSGVDLFFVLSGFLIGGILMDVQQSPKYYAPFFVRRFCRIVPIYLVIISPLFIIPFLSLQSKLSGFRVANGSLFPVWLYLCFLQNFGMAWTNAFPGYTAVTWSLAVEEQFYLLLPPIIRHIKIAQLPRWILPAIVAAPLIRMMLAWLIPTNATMSAYVLLPCRWDSLLLGVLGAWLFRVPHWRQYLIIRLSRLRVVLCFLAVGLVALSLTGGPGAPLMTSVGYTWIALFYTTLMLVALLNSDGLLKRFLSSPLLKPLATISYAVYLLHVLVTSLTYHFVLHQKPRLANWIEAAVGFGALLLTFSIALLSWRFFESKILRIGQRLKYEPSQLSPPA